MTTGRPVLLAGWSARLVILLLLLCGFYGSYRAVHLAIVNDEVGMLDCVHGQSYARLLFAADWSSQANAHFLNVLLAKPCVQLLPLNEITASRLPSLLGLALFLWGVWRIGLEFPTGVTRVLITLALLSNAFLLDFFSLSRGYGLAVGFTVLSLSFLMQASMSKSADDGSARRQAGASLWLACGAALSSMAFLHFYVALLVVTLWLGWRTYFKIHRWGSALVLAAVYVPRVVIMRQDYLGGDVGFLHDTVRSLVGASFYDLSAPQRLITFLSISVSLLVWLLAYRGWRERIGAARRLSMLILLVPVLCMTAHKLLGARYPQERTALFLVPAVVLNIGVLAAWSRLGWVRLSLWGLLLAYIGIGLQGANLSHTRTWRECADIPPALLALREAHQQTGQDVMVAISGSKWTVWYYAEHLLGLHPEPSESDTSYLRTYGWLTVYEWRVSQTYFHLSPDNPLLPGTTHLLLSLLSPDDQRLLVTPLPGGLAQRHFYPASATTLEMLIAPQHQGAVTFPDGRKYVGEFRHGAANGQGTGTWPDGQKYVGEYKRGKPNGQGTATWPDGRKYVGEYRDGVANGHGTYTRPDGQKYVGEYKDGVPNGRGTATWPDGEKYMGEYKDGEPNGQGTYTWADGRKYVGEFREGQVDGVGKMIYPDGRVEDGSWKQGQFAGTASH